MSHIVVTPSLARLLLDALGANAKTHTPDAPLHIGLEMDRGGYHRRHGRRSQVSVGVIKSLWASIQGDPVFMRRVNGWLTIFWLAMIPISIVFGLLSSVAYVSALSLWALVSGHWSAWLAARVEVEQAAEAEQLQASPIESRVVEKMIEQTNVMPAGTNQAPTT